MLPWVPRSALLRKEFDLGSDEDVDTANAALWRLGLPTLRQRVEAGDIATGNVSHIHGAFLPGARFCVVASGGADAATHISTLDADGPEAFRRLEVGRSLVGPCAVVAAADAPVAVVAGPNGDLLLLRAEGADAAPTLVPGGLAGAEGNLREIGPTVQSAPLIALDGSGRILIVSQADGRQILRIDIGGEEGRPVQWSMREPVTALAADGPDFLIGTARGTVYVQPQEQSGDVENDPVATFVGSVKALARIRAPGGQADMFVAYLADGTVCVAQGSSITPIYDLRAPARRLVALAEDAIARLTGDAGWAASITVLALQEDGLLDVIGFPAPSARPGGGFTPMSLLDGSRSGPAHRAVIALAAQSSKVAVVSDSRALGLRIELRPLIRK